MQRERFSEDDWRKLWPPGARIDAGKLGWAAGEVGLASYTGVSSIYLLFYATDVLGIPAAWAGLALLIPRIWNIVSDPIVGFLSDRTETRFGRRRPYLLGGALVWGAAFFLLFNLPRLNDPLLEAVLFGSVFLLEQHRSDTLPGALFGHARGVDTRLRRAHQTRRLQRDRRSCGDPAHPRLRTEAAGSRFNAIAPPVSRR